MNLNKQFKFIRFLSNILTFKIIYIYLKFYFLYQHIKKSKNIKIKLILKKLVFLKTTGKSLKQI
jgi:hypothetical protein